MRSDDDDDLISLQLIIICFSSFSVIVLTSVLNINLYV